jgi:hypothetical protein
MDWQREKYGRDAGRGNTFPLTSSQLEQYKIAHIRSGSGYVSFLI